jgi:hypothetical protein
MPMKRCDRGHYFDGAKHTFCPACGLDELDLGMTRPFSPDREARAATVCQGPGRPSPSRGEETVAAGAGQSGFDPVVGWLVCVGGTDRGRDWRIRSERNYLGRSEQMDICIRGDQAISRENHAIISFNPKNCVFKLLPGDGRGLVYLNGADLDMPRELKAYDLIELGATRLLFVPFCCERFQWQNDAGFQF